MGTTRARAAPEITIRQYRPGDEAALLAAFNRVFAQIDPTFHPRPMEVWRWRYRRNPAGWRIWLALLEDGTVVGQQAGTPVRVVHDGRRVTWNQVGDTFTDPAYSRALRNPGLFFRVAKPFSDTYGGAPPDRDPILYGMPTRRAHRIGERQLHYATVRDQNRLEAAPDDLRATASTAVEVEEVDAVPDEVDALFERVAADRGAIAVRDRAYLTWRYLENPEASYRIALARRSGPGRELAGLAVYRPGGFDGVEGGLVCDWLVPPADDAAAGALQAWLAARAREDGAERLVAVLPETCPEFGLFQRAGWRVRPTGYYLVGRCYHGPYPMRWVYHRWSYTLGDFDLC